MVWKTEIYRVLIISGQYCGTLPCILFYSVKYLFLVMSFARILLNRLFIAGDIARYIHADIYTSFSRLPNSTEGIYVIGGLVAQVT